MPLRDHFRPPLAPRRLWDEFHGQLPAMIVLALNRLLPEGYAASPGVHLGNMFEVDVATFQEDDPTTGPFPSGGGTATLVAPSATKTLEVDLPDPDEYEVRVYDDTAGRRLVAAIEIVSPSNKDRPESRRAFVEKVSALLREGVCVSLVDIVTVRHFNLYAELLALVGSRDPTVGEEPPATYAATLRRRGPRRRTFVDAWYAPLGVGQPLPTLPLWLDVGVGVALDLEAAYEETCRAIRIA